MSERTFVTNTPEETETLGGKLARALPKERALITLHGGLGAGKTAFTRGIGRYLGTDEVMSPTFTIVQEHDTEPRLLHFDAYRLSDSEELYEMGFDDYLAENAWIVMEWAELVEDAIPEERLDVTMNGSGDGPRSIRIGAVGERYERVLERL